MANRLKLLVIDDDDAQVRLLTKLVGKSFYGRLDMTAMTDATEALRWIKQCHPDLVITDLEMPGASGLELLRAAKHCNPTSQVLLLTGHSSTQALLDALENGASDYLIKPLDPGAIVDLLREAIQRIERWRAALHDTICASDGDAPTLVAHASTN
jgi:two-component system response regulator YesN